MPILNAKARKEEKAKWSLVMIIGIFIFWSLLFFVLGYILFFSNRSSVSHEGLHWSCIDTSCNISFVLLNGSSKPRSVDYSLWLMETVSSNVSSFKWFGIGRVSRKKMIQKNEGTSFLQPEQSKTIRLHVSVEKRPTFIAVKLK